MPPYLISHSHPGEPLGLMIAIWLWWCKAAGGKIASDWSKKELIPILCPPKLSPCTELFSFYFNFRYIHKWNNEENLLLNIKHGCMIRKNSTQTLISWEPNEEYWYWMNKSASSPEPSASRVNCFCFCWCKWHHPEEGDEIIQAFVSCIAVPS